MTTPATCARVVITAHSASVTAQLGRGGSFAFLPVPVLFLALTAAPADAADRRVWHGAAPSSIVIGPPTVEHATATVTFQNTTVHNSDEAFALDWQGIEIDVQFDWQADGTNAERIVVTPPDGYIALPDSITVPEGQADEIQIVKFEGM